MLVYGCISMCGRDVRKARRHDWQSKSAEPYAVTISTNPCFSLRQPPMSNKPMGKWAKQRQYKTKPLVYDWSNNIPPQRPTPTALFFDLSFETRTWEVSAVFFLLDSSDLQKKHLAIKKKRRVNNKEKRWLVVWRAMKEIKCEEKLFYLTALDNTNRNY